MRRQRYACDVGFVLDLTPYDDSRETDKIKILFDILQSVFLTSKTVVPSNEILPSEVVMAIRRRGTYSVSCIFV